MKLIYLTLTLSVAILIAGCGAKEATQPEGSASGTSTTSSTGSELGPIATAASYDAGTKKIGDKGVCIICSVNAGAIEGEEEIKQTLDYKGKMYVFCNESEKAEFISDPAKFVSK